MRLAMATLAAVLTFASSAEARSAPVAQAGPTTVKVLSWNVAGAVRTAPDFGIATYDTDPFRFVDVLVDRITAEQPQLVGLQEMCGSQVNYLISKLAAAGYPMQHHFEPDSVHEELCKHKDGAERPYAPAGVGKAVLAVGSAVPEAPDGEPVCLRWQVQVPLRFCSIHTAPDRIPTVASTLNFWAYQDPVIAVGDFNAEPNDPAMHDIYFSDPDTDTEGGGGAFYEPERNTDLRTHADGHIDHVLADHKNFSPEGMQLWVQPTDGMCDGDPCSDHSMVWATLEYAPQGLAALAGRWLSHALVLDIAADGHAIASWRTYEWCGPGVEEPCDRMEGNQIINGGRAEITFTEGGTGGGSGEVVSTTDPDVISTGPVSLAVIQSGEAQLQHAGGVLHLCGPAVQQSTTSPCGA